MTLESHKSTFNLRANPEITNINKLKISKNTPTTISIMGYGFWSNKKKIDFTTASFSGIETNELEAPLFDKEEHEVVRTFLIPQDQHAFGITLSSYDLFQPVTLPSDSEPTLTTKYPAFTALEVEPSIISENQLTLVVPAVSSETIVDVIVANRAGYGRASTDPNQSSDQTARFETTLQISSSGNIVVE